MAPSAIGNKTFKSKKPFRIKRQLVNEAIKIFKTNAVGLITELGILNSVMIAI